MTPPNPAAPRRFTQGNVTEGPRARQHRDALARRRGDELTHPAPLQSLVASAKRLTKKKLTGGSFKKSTASGWQEDAWEMYDLVGEQHFLGSTLANQASKARFYVGILGDGADTTDLPDATEDQALQNILDNVGGGPVGFSQMVQRMLVNLFVAGDGWLVGIPKQLLPDYEPEDEEEALAIEEWSGSAILDPTDDTELTMGDLEWRMLSVSEVTIKREGMVMLHLGAEASEKIDVNPDLLFMIRVWRPHPRRWWEADSPTRSSLPVLRELVGLTMHISAQVDSRLAGAGLLLVPASAARALKIAAGLPEDSPDDPFTDALMEAMLTPIGDRANASALVPLVVTVPDGTAQDFQFITFAKPLDTEARNLRDEAIRRLALGQDAPPELLLGTAGMNHWGAWLVRDDVVSTHLEPPLALIADALTTQYLRPMMAEMGYTKEQISNHVVWYDTSKMVVQPNRAADALTLYDRDALSDEALREANGFDETDAPETAKMDLASQKAFLMVQENPGLMANPGLPVLVEQLKALISGNPMALPKKGSGSEVAAPGAPTAPPLDENGKAIPTSNSAPAAGGRGVGAQGAKAPAPTPKTGDTQAPAAPRKNPVSSTGTPPAAPKQGPALAAEIYEAFANTPEGKAFIDGYLEKFAGGSGAPSPIAYDFNETEDGQTVNPHAPGLKADGTPPQCKFCAQEAEGWILWAEGAAFVPFCQGHRGDAIEAIGGDTEVDQEGSYALPAQQAEGESFSVTSTATDPADPEDSDNPDIVLGYDAFAVGDSLEDPAEPADQPAAPVGAIVVLIPSEDDAINAAVQGIDAHMTLAYLANDITQEAMPPVEELVDQMERVAEQMGFQEITLRALETGPLGDAVVTLFESTSAPLQELVDAVLKPGTPVEQLNSSRNKYPFRPHVSLGYPSEDASPEEVAALQFHGKYVTFDRVGVWVGAEHIDFPLGRPMHPQLAEGYKPENFLDTVQKNLDNPPVEVQAPATAQPVSSKQAARATVDFMGQPALNEDFRAKAPSDAVPESASVVRSLADALQDTRPQHVELTLDNG